MFFVGSTRISTKLDLVHLVDRPDNSVVLQVVFGKALLLIEVLLVSDLSRGAPLNPLRRVLFGCASVLVEEVLVHFR